MESKEVRLQPADLRAAHNYVISAMQRGTKIDINKIEDPKLRADLLIYKLREMSKNHP